MFRRRPRLHADIFAESQLANLVRANRLMSDGKPLQAAPLFAGAAQAMPAVRHPRRAANLYARAAHAFADGGDAERALANAKAALALFLQTNLTIRAATFYTTITSKLAARKMNAAVAELQKEFGPRITALPTTPRPLPPLRRGILPANCPKCGAPVHTEDATWVDENTLECEYCGAFIKNESLG
jgi:hypothetical protein